jgi:hypothetical protein
MSTSISDKVWSEVLAKNSLSKLETIEIQKCSKVFIQKTDYGRSEKK